MRVDLHTHTLASGHAFGTIYENAEAAKDQGLKILGIADHGPSLVGAPNEIYFKCGDRLPKTIQGVRVLFGVEASIINQRGELDLSDKTLSKLDFVIAGLHLDSVYKDQGVGKNTQAMIRAMSHPRVKIISHPYSTRMNIDIEKVTLAAIEQHVLPEINASYFRPDKKFEPEIWERIKIMVKILKEHQQKMLINSDAHSPFEVGRFDAVAAKFRELGIGPKDVLNNDPQAVLKFLELA